MKRKYTIISILITLPLSLFAIVILLISKNGLSTDVQVPSFAYIVYKGNVYSKYYDESRLISHAWVVEGDLSSTNEKAYYINDPTANRAIMDKQITAKVKTYKNDKNNTFICVDGGFLYDSETFARVEIELPDCFSNTQRISMIVIENGKTDKKIKLQNYKEILAVLESARISAKSTDSSKLSATDNVSRDLYVKVYFNDFPAYYNLGVVTKNANGETGIECSDRDYSISARAWVKFPDSIQSTLTKDLNSLFD